MSKELEAFNGICCNTNQCYPDFAKQRKIVETALKENQDSKNKLKKLLKTIEEKQKNAESSLKGTHDLDKRERLKGEIEAYYDIVCLIKFKYGVEK